MPDEYLMAGGNPARTCYVPEGQRFGGEFETRWKTAVSADGPPVVLDGVVYVAVQRSNPGEDRYDYRVVGYDLDDGSGVCRFDFPQGGPCHELASDGRHLIAITDDAVEAFNPKAERRKWSHSFPDDQNEAGSRTVTAADGTVYADDWETSMIDDEVVDVKVRRLDPESGEDTAVTVGRATDTYTGARTRIGYRDGSVFLVTNGDVVGADQRGGDVWREPIPELQEADYSSTSVDALAVGERNVYVGPKMAKRQDDLANTEELETYVTAFDATTGTRQWRVATGKSAVNSIAVAGDAVLVGILGGGLRVFDAADGSLRWENYDFGGRVSVVGETVYTTLSEGGSVHLVGAALEDGSESWRHELDTGLGSLMYPVVLDDAVLVPGSELVCLEPSTTAVGAAAGGEATGQGTDECPSCGTPVDDSDAFCPSCGTDLDDETCPACGESLDGGEAFCPSCGADLDDETCPACGESLDGGEAFCPSCGADLD